MVVADADVWEDADRATPTLTLPEYGAGPALVGARTRWAGLRYVKVDHIKVNDLISRRAGPCQ